MLTQLKIHTVNGAWEEPSIIQNKAILNLDVENGISILLRKTLLVQVLEDYRIVEGISAIINHIHVSMIMKMVNIWTARHATFLATTIQNTDTNATTGVNVNLVRALITIVLLNSSAITHAERTILDAISA